MNVNNSEEFFVTGLGTYRDAKSAVELFEAEVQQRIRATIAEYQSEMVELFGSRIWKPYCEKAQTADSVMVAVFDWMDSVRKKAPANLSRLLYLHQDTDSTEVKKHFATALSSLKSRNLFLRVLHLAALVLLGFCIPCLNSQSVPTETDSTAPQLSQQLTPRIQTEISSSEMSPLQGSLHPTLNRSRAGSSRRDSPSTPSPEAAT